MILLSFVMLLLNSVFSPIKQAQYVDVNISEFQKTFENFSSRDVSWCFFYHFIMFYGDVNWSHRKMGT